jgi:hypothetical protein
MSVNIVRIEYCNRIVDNHEGEQKHGERRQINIFVVLLRR